MIKRFTLIISWVLILSTIGGVYATWDYATYPIQSVHQNLGVTLSEFHYPPEEILPGGDNDSEVELGGNHYTVVKLIVDEAGRGYSLNDANSISNDQKKKSRPVSAFFISFPCLLHLIRILLCVQLNPLTRTRAPSLPLEAIPL